jgi:glycosyltransferase involved in cell wall biosynthesis
MKPLSVLMIAACPFPAPRGTPTRILRLAEGVAALGHEVHVAAYHLGEPLQDPPFELHRIADIPAYRRMESGPSYGKIWVDWKLTRKVRQLLLQHDYDLIHAHHYEGLLSGLAARRSLEIPIIYDAHTLAGAELPDYSLGLPRRAARWIGNTLDRNLPGRADYCVTASRGLAGTLRQVSNVRPDRVSVVTNGVELEHFARESTAQQSNGTKRLVYTGSLAPYQGIDLLLEMFAALCKERKDVGLLIATNDATATLEEQIEQLGLRGKVDLREADYARLPELLASADIALNPRPRCDGVPQKLLNYMAAGCPVVSMAGSAPHVRHEHSALLVEEPSAVALLSAVRRLLEDPALARRLGRTARLVAEQELGWASAARAAVEAYRRVTA